MHEDNHKCENCGEQHEHEEHDYPVVITEHDVADTFTQSIDEDFVNIRFIGCYITGYTTFYSGDKNDRDEFIRIEPTEAGARAMGMFLSVGEATELIKKLQKSLAECQKTKLQNLQEIVSKVGVR